MSNGRYKVVHTAVPVNDLMEWASWFETAYRHVVDQWIGNVRVSTVFLGLDHNMGSFGDGPPILFETLVFGGPLDGEMRRCATWEEAVEQHKAMALKVLKEEPVWRTWVRRLNEWHRNYMRRARVRRLTRQR